MIGILGAGLAGLSTAYHLGDNYIVFEAEDTVGGLCRSNDLGGFVFDRGPHIIYTRNEYIWGLLKKLLGSNLVRKQRKSYIYLKGAYVKYPFEANLEPLPNELKLECILSALHREKVEASNFYDWIYSTFGKGVADYYMVPYNRKIWKYDLDKMHTDWIAGRVPTPAIEDMIRGAIMTQKQNFGPNAIFQYPRKGGIGALPNSLLKWVKNISLNSIVTRIKTGNKKVKVQVQKNGKNQSYEFDKVVSSLPLPELLGMMDDAPEEIHKASLGLEHNSLYCLGIGLRKTKVSPYHAVYFPEEEYIFNRISFPMNLSKHTVPKNRSSILVEVTFKKNEKISAGEVRGRVIEDLIRCGYIGGKEEIVQMDEAVFKYAYVILDLEYRRKLELIHGYLDTHNIIPCGRFGEWKYLNMDHTILSGKSAAERIVAK